jgi:MFS family permease
MSTVDAAFDTAWQFRLRFYFAAFALSTAGDWLYGVVLTVYVYDRTHSTVWIAGMNILRFLPYVVLAPLVGYVADRFPRRLVMIGADAARAIMMGSISLVVAAHGPTVVVVAMAIVSTAVSTLYAPAMNAMLAEGVPPERLGGVNAVFSTIHSLALLVGPAVGAVMVKLAPADVGIALNGGTFVVSGLAVALGAVPRATHATATDGPAEEPEHADRTALLKGFYAITREAYARVLVLAYAGLSFVYGTETVLLLLAAERRMHTHGSGYGLLLAASGAGGIAAAPLVARLTRARRHALGLAVGMVGAGLPLSCLAFTTTPAVGYVLMAVDGASNVAIDVIVITLLQQATEHSVTARAYAMLDGAGTAAMLFGMFAAPCLVWLLGLQVTLLVCGLTLPAQLLFGANGLRAVDREAHRVATESLEVADA